MTGPWVLRLRCMRGVLWYLLPSEQIAYCEALMLPRPVSKRDRFVYRTGQTCAIIGRMGRYCHGSSKQYNTSGVMTSDVMFIDNKLHGTWFSYYDDGTLKQTTSYSHDVKDGVTRVWDNTGILRSEHMYVDGKKEGPFQEWDSNGNFQCRGFYHDDKIQGPYMSCSNNGFLTICCFDQGKIHGMCQNYFPSREIYSLFNCEHGNPEGEGFTWYKNGNLKSCEHYCKGKLDGLWEKYYQDGKLMVRKNYKKGKPEGLCERWSPSKKQMIQHYYKDGKKIKNEEHYSNLGDMFSS